MPSITVEEASSRSDRRKFIDLPYRLYRNNPDWVPPLRMDVAHALSTRNAFFEHGQIATFLARDEKGGVVGRIAGIINGKHLEKYDDGNGFVGFFETVERYDVAAALLDAATSWLRDKGMRGARGPTNPSMNDICGMLVDGFDRRPSIMMPYNPPWYPEYFERYGFARAMTMWAYYVHEKYVQTEKLKRGVDLIHKRYPGLTVRTLDMARFDEDAAVILDVYNEAWSRNWGHVPMTSAEFRQLASQLKKVVDPRMVYIVEHEGAPIAFSISLPNLNQVLRQVKDGRLFPLGLLRILAGSKFGAINEVRTLLMGVRLSWQGRGLDAILNHATISNGPRYGYVASELSWVLDSNPKLINSLVHIGGVKDKEYAMYEIAW